ncbi:MAG: zf-TFIIB domain-containing protein [Myxococcales bacterium]|nr:zf-TFIIB domain-containing protein [Myxococcales bacterium]
MSSNPAQCPRCRGVLWGRALPAGAGHACGNCGGVWLDHAAATRMTQVLCSETLGHANAGARTAQPVDTRAGIACPACGSALERTTVGQTGVEIDYCSAHGTWFDRDELGRVAQAYATARAYGRHGSGALVGGAAVAGAAVAGGAVAGAALVASQQNEVQRYAQSLDAADVAEVAIEGGSAAFEVGAAVGDAADVAEVAGGAAEVAGGVFEILGGIFEGLG